jgi:hypothetical protein
MSALPVAFPEISATQTHRSARADAQSRSITGATAAASNWKLTDRGIAVVMLIAAVILTAALAVLGITAIRVTSADYDTGVPQSQQAYR